MFPLALFVMALMPLASRADTTLRITPGTTVEITSYAQPVIITGTDGDELSIRGGLVDASKRRVEVTARPTTNGRVDPIIVRLPTKSRLEVTAFSGPVTVNNAPERAEIFSMDGPVNVTGGRGLLEVEATGAISITDFTGEHLSVNGLAGAISIRGATGTIEIESVNGPIFLDRVTSRDVSLSAVNGLVRWRGDFDPKGRYQIESHNGGVELHVPASFDARLAIETFGGGLGSALPAQITGNSDDVGKFLSERDITAIYGRGRAQIEISTFNGGVQVLRLDGF